MANLTAQEKKALKGRGYIITNDGEHFIARIITIDGTLNADEMACITEAARRFGSGVVAMTSRMTVEVQGIPYENIEAFDFCEDSGTHAAFCSSKYCYSGHFYLIFNKASVLTASTIPTSQKRVTIFGSGMPCFW